MKGLVVLLVALAACVETHDPTQKAIQNDDCTNCHSGNLVHPEASFPLMSMGSMHTNIACQDCHKFTSGPGIDGFHADCTSTCHLQTKQSSCCEAVEPNHLGRVSPIDGTTPYAWDPMNHDFCLSCHPAGLL